VSKFMFRTASLIARLLAPVFLLILLPLLLMGFLEKQLAINLDTTDRSLIHFFLLLFFCAYLAILGFRSPLNALQDWLREFEASLSEHFLKSRRDPPEPDRTEEKT